MKKNNSINYSTIFNSQKNNKTEQKTNRIDLKHLKMYVFLPKECPLSNTFSVFNSSRKTKEL